MVGSLAGKPSLGWYCVKSYAESAWSHTSSMTPSRYGATSVYLNSTDFSPTRKKDNTNAIMVLLFSTTLP